jgi:type IV secretory pathway TrbD component
VLILTAVALLAGVVAGTGSNDAVNLAVMTGLAAVFGGGIWVVSSALAWLFRIVREDVRDEFG